MLWAATLRRPYGSARIVSIDIARRWRSRACKPCSRRTTSRASRRSVRSTGPTRVLRRAGVNTAENRSPSWPPTTQRRPAGLPPPSIVECEPLARRHRPRGGASTTARAFPGDARSAAATRTPPGSVVVEGVYETPTRPGAARTRGRAGDPGRRRRARSLRDHPMGACRPRQIVECLECRTRSDPLPSGRHRRCLRRHGRHLAAHPPLPCCRCGPVGRSRWSTTEPSRSSATSSAIQPRCGSVTKPTTTGSWSRSTARLLLDGGAYTHTQPAVLTNAAYFTVGPYRCDNVVVDAAVDAHQQPTVRCDARFRCGAVVLSPRVPDGPAGGGTRPAIRSNSGGATRSCRRSRWRRRGQIIEGSLPTLGSSMRSKRFRFPNRSTTTTRGCCRAAPGSPRRRVGRSGVSATPSA